MLTVVDFGTAPTNLTTPLRVAVGTVVLLTEARGPAFHSLQAGNANHLCQSKYRNEPLRCLRRLRCHANHFSARGAGDLIFYL
jgi:hypothetical protein